MQRERQFNAKTKDGDFDDVQGEGDQYMPKPKDAQFLGIATPNSARGATTDRDLLDHRETAPVPMPEMMGHEHMTADSIEGGSTSRSGQ